jgi:hypothetical protein
MSKQLLIVDNDDQSEAIDKIYSVAKAKGIDIECHQLNIGLPDGGDVVDDNGKIDLNLVRNKLQNLYGDRRFHMIAFDFKLNDPEDGVDGVRLISAFNGNIKTSKAKKILYSSELTEIVEGYLERYKENSSFEQAWGKFKTLININILEFCRREDYELKIVEFISKVPDDENDFLIDLLRGYGDLSFIPFDHNYEGYTLDQLADKLETGDDEAKKIRKNLIEFGVAKLISLPNG